MVLDTVDVSVIIVNYNTCRMTSECIESIYEKTHDILIEIILIDNASTDGSKEYFSSDVRIHYVYLNENIGFGRANNEGLRIAKGRNILFLNSDTLLVNNAIKILSDYLDRSENVGVVGGNLYSKNGYKLHSYRRFSPLCFDLNILLGGLPAKIFFGRNSEHNNGPNPIKVNTIVGADLMIKKVVLDRVGTFDPRFFMYCEETELCHRVRKAKYSVVSLPNAHIIHLEGASFSPERRIDRIRMNRMSLNMYCRKHYGFLYRKMINIVWYMIVWSRIIYYYFTDRHMRNFWMKIRKCTIV